MSRKDPGPQRKTDSLFTAEVRKESRREPPGIIDNPPRPSADTSPLLYGKK